MVFPLALYLAASVDPKALDATLDRAWKASGAPAVAAAVVQDGKSVWTQSVGKSDVEKSLAVTPETPFRIASLTKAFTATAILQLVAEKKLGLDDAVGASLPDLPDGWKKVTVRQLLTHTSGIPSYTERPDFIKDLTKRFTPSELIALTADTKLDFDPGTEWKYDNTGYVILGALLEKKEGKPYPEILRKRIFSPLGMKHTDVDLGDKPLSNGGYTKDDKPAILIHMSQPYAAGSIVSTIGDMAKWAAAQGSPKLLPPALWQEMLSPVTLKNGRTHPYGFAWSFGQANGVPTVEHSGGIPGYATYILRVPSKNLAVVVLTNSDTADPRKIAAALAETADPGLVDQHAAIADPDPKVTDATKILLQQLAEDKVDRTKLSSTLSERLTPDVGTAIKNLLASFGGLKELRLVKVDGKMRTYYAVFEKASANVIAAIEDGKFTAFAIRPS